MPAALKQIIGRGVRYRSHNPGEKVNVYKLILTTLRKDVIPNLDDRDYNTKIREFLMQDNFSGDAILYRILEKKIVLQNLIYDMIGRITSSSVSKDIAKHSGEMGEADKYTAMLKEEARLLAQQDEIQQQRQTDDGAGVNLEEMD